MNSRQAAQLLRTAEVMIQGSFSRTTRTCGNLGCRCRRGKRHGPHTYLTFKLPGGRTSAIYVPRHAVADGREGLAAWARFWELAVEIAKKNRDTAAIRWRGGGGRDRREHAPTRR